ncbi:hypothetical protein JB92DRAFT_2837290 [Gautieria morchelliformis]|nr:hypothetical protein JB92DRAFT_2837290 [Gautieria morchelliformis]
MQTQYFDLEGVRPSGSSHMLTIAQKPEKIFPVYIHKRQRGWGATSASAALVLARMGTGAWKAGVHGAVRRIAHRMNSLALKMTGMAAFQAYAKDVLEAPHYELFPNLQNYHSRMFKSIALPENGGVREPEVYIETTITKQKSSPIITGREPGEWRLVDKLLGSEKIEAVLSSAILPRP